MFFLLSASNSLSAQDSLLMGKSVYVVKLQFSNSKEVLTSTTLSQPYIEKYVFDSSGAFKRMAYANQKEVTGRYTWTDNKIKFVFDGVDYTDTYAVEITNRYFISLSSVQSKFTIFGLIE